MFRLPAKYCLDGATSVAATSAGATFAGAIAIAVVAAASVLVPATAWAKSSDRSQEMAIEAGATSGTLDDRQPTVLSGGVTIIQGSLHIDAGTATVSTSGGEPVRAVLSGSPVRLKQQLDDGTPMSATASKVDYDLKDEIVIFTGNVHIKQPRGTVQSQRVVYNMRTGVVNSGGEGNGRVRMLINPRNKQVTPTPDAEKPPAKQPGTN
jgi:lipopolysaccharide export system protein LptA